MRTSVVVRPVRFTDRIPEMTDFLRLLGLAPRVEGNAGGWAALVADAGMVALHSAERSQIRARPGQSTLSFETDDADALAAALVAAGFPDAHVYDEGYGRVLAVTDPLGDLVEVDEHGDDLYGYRLVDGGPATPGLRVVPVRFTDESDRYARFLHPLGLTGSPDPSYATFEAAGGDHGAVGVHHLFSDDLPVAGGPGAGVQLTFLTTADLAPLQRRLEAAGHALTRHDEEFGSFLDVLDPDGQHVQVHRAR